MLELLVVFPTLSTVGRTWRQAVRTILWFCLTLGPMAVVSTTVAGDWPQFRGADARGVADGAQFPETWSATDNIRWSVPIDGRAWSSPIVVGNRVYVTTVVRKEGEPDAAKPGLYFGGDRRVPADAEHVWQLLCLDLNQGNVIWQLTLHEGKPQTPRHIKNSYASETPVSDGKRVVVAIGDVGIFAVDLAGKLLWSRDLAPVPTRFGWGTAASPVLHDGRLYFVNDNEEGSYLLALDLETGNEVFKVERDEKSNWATPYVWHNELRTEIITPGTGKVRSYDLDGQLLYEFGGCSSITIATPYEYNGLLYVSSGYVLDKKQPIFALRPGGKGDLTLGDEQTSNDTIVWCQKMAAPYNPTTLAYKGIIYVLYDRSFLATYDAATGEPILPRQRIPNGEAFTASPWAANDRIYFLNEFGKTYVYEAGRECKFLHTNELPDAEALYMATPAIADDVLLIRSAAKLYCIGRSS